MDRCAVSEDEVNYDLDQCDASIDDDFRLRAVNRRMDDFDDITDLTNALEFCGDAGLISSIKQCIRERRSIPSESISALLTSYYLDQEELYDGLSD